MGSIAIRRSSRLLIVAVLAASLFAGFSVQQAHASEAPTPIPIETLCANPWTGQISFSFSGCPPGTQPIDLTVGEVDVCVSLYTGHLSTVPPGGCSAGSFPLTLGGGQPVTLCAAIFTGAVRYSATSSCGSGEMAVVVEPAIQTHFDCVVDGDCPRPLPEVTGTSGSVTSFLAVSDPGGGQITDVNVFVNFSHAWIADLDVYLESPAGTVVELFTDIFCFDEGDLSVTLDDGAGSSITTIPCAAQMSGTYQPEGSLADFNTELATGTWELQITDDFLGDPGLLWDWTLEITTTQGALPNTDCSDCLVLIPGTRSGGAAGVTVSQLPVAVPGGSQIADLNLTVDISHTWLNNLHIYLQSPSGTIVKVFQQLCSSSDDLEVVYDDEAAGGLSCVDRLGFNSFQPAPGSLSAFDGEDPTGTWLLVIIDDFGSDSGTLDNWALDFTYS